MNDDETRTGRGDAAGYADPVTPPGPSADHAAGDDVVVDHPPEPIDLHAYDPTLGGGASLAELEASLRRAAYGTGEGGSAGRDASQAERDALWAEEADESAPDWFATLVPFWWGRSQLTDRREALTYTITFVEWLLAVWRWEKKLIPPCWIRHPDIVQEMWALALAHRALHAIDNPAGPAQWLSYLDLQRRRLQDNNAAAGCATRGHHELIAPNPAAARDRLASYGEGDQTTPELPLTVQGWSWPHDHPHRHHQAP